MVARTPSKHLRKTAAVAPPILSPTLIRETVKKVDKCMARLQELQCAVNGGNKVVSGVSLSPRSTRGYLRTSLRCKQETTRTKNTNAQRSPPGKLPKITSDEWQRMSAPARLLGETMGEILQASQLAKNIVEAVSSLDRNPATADDPKTPATATRKQQKKASMENSGLCTRRRREKQVVLKDIRSESNALPLQRAKSRINFKVSPVRIKECEKENCRYIANRVSPRNRPWVRKTVLFPNPLFHSSPNSQLQRFGKTKSPVISRNRQAPHKFLVKSPPTSKFQVKIRSPPVSVLAKKSPKASTAAKLRRSFSPSRLANKLVSPLRGTKPFVLNNEGAKVVEPKEKRSFSPSRMAERLMSPLRSRKSVQKNEDKMMNGVKHRPASFYVRFPSPRRI